MNDKPASQKPISDLRRRMLEDMAVRRLGEKTRHDYIKHVETFTRFLGRLLNTATAEDLRRFQVHEVQAGAKPPKMNTQVSALRFFLKITLGRFDLAHALFARKHAQAALTELAPLDAAEPANPAYRNLRAGCLALLGDEAGAEAGGSFLGTGLLRWTRLP